MMGVQGMSFSTLLLVSTLSLLLLLRPTTANIKSYVVYLGAHPPNSEVNSLETQEARRVVHHDFLGYFLGSKERAQDAIFYSYTKYINGFAANLDEELATEIKNHPEVISVFENKGHKRHTTRSWEFMGLENMDGSVPDESLWTMARFGEDTIIANIDFGVWPESESFNDDGMGPVPEKWKGMCKDETANPVRCNRKLIGARYYYKAYVSGGGQLNATKNSARDDNGHGTHTLSTAGGAFVPSANTFGYGNGTAKGGSPKARVAAYKACWPPAVNGGECFGADIVAAFDDAILDGVDVLSVSLGAGGPADYFEDGIAIGAFHAVTHGIMVVCAAGNSGPTPGSVVNMAPWILTVGASTMDREFPSYVSFNKKHKKGQSLSPVGLPENKFYPMISSIEAKAANTSDLYAELCLSGTLDPLKVKGKIVVCLDGYNARVEKGIVVRQAGGVGMILANNQASRNEIIAEAHVLPATHITYDDGLDVFSYLDSTELSFGYITIPKTVLGTEPAPVMAVFSSQGPSLLHPEFLKPDITAPGVSVLAAYTEAEAPTGLPNDSRRVAYNIESGTSMACPHISGVVGLLRTLHPEWSPSAIKSAIMTSARTRDNTKEPMKNSSLLEATPFSYGSGHVRPNQAMDPGLIYDICTTDYLNYLCALGYDSRKIATFSVESFTCPNNPPKPEDLNYPSISVPNLSLSVTVKRTVTNVGSPGLYTATVKSPPGVSATVKPMTLKFDDVGEKKSFEVTLEAKGNHKSSDYGFGSIAWTDGKHHVRSPMVVKMAS